MLTIRTMSAFASCNASDKTHRYQPADGCSVMVPCQRALAGSFVEVFVEVLDRLLLFPERLGKDIPAGDHAQKSVLVDDREMTNPFCRHHASAFSQFRRWLTARHRCGHHVFYDYLQRVKVAGDYPIEKIPLGENAHDHLTAI